MKQPSRVVFVGNIPWEKTEEDMLEIFSSVGPTVAFRLVYDRDTGKSKGYGFCEFEDPEVALSAVRNLNGYDIGGRFLRVDRADNEQMPPAPSVTASAPSRAHHGAKGAAFNMPPALQPAAETTATVESVSKFLSMLQPGQLLDLIANVKTMASQNYEQTKQLLETNPTLAYAMYQAMSQMNLIEPQTQQKARAAASRTPPKRPPPPQTPAQAAAPVGTPVDVDRERLIRQILAMTSEQINALPADQRDSVLRVRAQYQPQQ